MENVLSISREVSFYLPKNLSPGFDGKYYFVTYVCEKSKFKRRKYKFDDEINLALRCYYNNGEKASEVDLEEITIQNSGFKLLLTPDITPSFGATYALVRIQHPSLESYDFPIYVKIHHFILTKLLSTSGYLSDGEIHGEYCLDFSLDDWRSCYFVLDERSNELELAKKIGNIMSSNKRVGIKRWIPGHCYIINSSTSVLYIGKISHYKYINSWYANRKKFIPLIIDNRSYSGISMSEETDGYLVYFFENTENDRFRIKDLKSLSSIIKRFFDDSFLDYPTSSYYTYIPSDFKIYREYANVLGWEFGEIIKNDIDGIDLRAALDQSLLIEIIKLRDAKISDFHSVEKYLLGVYDRSLIKSTILDYSKEIFKSRVKDQIELFCRNHRGTGPTPTVDFILESNDYYLRGLRDIGAQYDFNKEEVKKLIQEVINLHFTP